MKRKCENRKDDILAYLEGSLKPVHRLELEAHLQDCDPCRTTLHEYESTWELLDLYPDHAPSPAFVPATLRAVQQDRAALRRLRFRRGAVAVAAGLLLAVVLFFAFQSSTPVDEPVTDDLARVETELLENLDLLEDLEFLEEYGEDLELAMEYDLYQIITEGDDLQ
jgi:anti-sigma factor RsiW